MHLPYDLTGPDFDPDFTLVLVVEDTHQDGLVVGSWVMLNAVHLEGFHVAEHARHTVGIIVALFVGMMETLKRGKIKAAVTIAQDPVIAKMAEEVGFQRIPGDLYQIRVPPAEAT